VFHLVCFIPCVSPRAFPPVLLSGGRVFHLVCFIPCVSPRVFHPVSFIPCLSSRVAVVMSIDLVQRREREHAMFSDTRQHLVQRGFPVESIRMLEGWDVRAGGESCDAPRPHQCCMWAFQHKFLPRAIRCFQEAAALRVILWMEDDARLKKGESARSVLKEALETSPSACRMGWRTKKWYGSHAAAFTLPACLAFQQDLKERTHQNKPLKHLYGLDTYWTAERDTICLDSGSPAMQLSPDPKFVDKKHPLRGRF
jgi:hypothetical protein